MRPAARFLTGGKILTDGDFGKGYLLRPHHRG